MIIATTSAQHLDPDDHRAAADRGLKLPKDAGHRKNQHRSGRIKRHRPHPRPITPGVVLADAGCGADMKFQAGLLDLALSYVPVCRSEAPKIRHDKPDLRRDAAAGGDVLGVQPNSSVWPDGEGPLPAKDLALSLPASAWQEVTWRAGVKGDLVSRFAAKRVRPAHGDDERDEPWSKLWLLIE